MRPSLIFPGDGFISNPAPTAAARLAYSRIILPKLSATSEVTDLFCNSCSTPHNSGNSAIMTVPPSPTSKSAVWPMAGFAEIPENPSDPPHFTPKRNADNGAGLRSILLISIKPSNVLITTSFNNFSTPLPSSCCCSKMYIGLLKLGSFSLNFDLKTAIWECWQPKLKIVTPATFGFTQ